MPEAQSPPNDFRRLDLAVVIDGLRTGMAPSSWMGRWLSPTYAAPEAFQRALHAHASARRGGLKTAPGGVADLYHDCVLAHLGQRQRAYVGRERGELVELTYEALHARVGALMSAWRAAGAEPGQSVCLVLPVGSDYLVALLTALRMGLIATPVPPHGPAFVRNRVAALKPDGLVAGERQRSWLAGTEVPVWPTAGTRETGVQASHGYPPGAPALRLFSAFGEDPLALHEVAAGPLHAALLRDALFVFALDGKDTLAMPGFEPLASQPTAVLAALMAGASWAEVSAAEVGEKPAVLAELGVTVLGVGRAGREALLAAGTWPKGAIRSWFRCMTDGLDLRRWDELGRLAVKSGAVCFNVVLCPVAGGALLFGPVQKQPPGLHVWPPPGQAWQLGEVGAGAMVALNDAGVYVPLGDGAAPKGTPHLLLAMDGEGYLCSGCIDPGPDSRTYPVAEVSAAVETHPEVSHATVVVSPGRSINEANLTLLAFMDDVRGPDGRFAPTVTAAELRAVVKEQMGEMFVPSRVEIFPLRPRLGDDGIDRGWCRSQYLGGALTEKARSELFVLLSRLSYMLDLRPKAAEKKVTP